MQAIQVQRTGGPEVLTLTEVEAPQPGPGEVRIEVAAAGVNFIDVYHRTGLYPMPLPLIPGAEGAGRVVAVGAGVETVKVGDRVASTELHGAYAQYAVAPADRVVHLPDGVSEELAAAVLLQGLTAHYLVHDSYKIQPGDTVLVQAGAGGVGLLLTQCAPQRGARVIGTVSALEKEKLARDAGAAEIIGYDSVAEDVRRLTDDKGIPAVYDGVGRNTFDASLASLRPHGVLVLYGYSSGPIPPFDINRLQNGGSPFLPPPPPRPLIATPQEVTPRADHLLRP